MSVDIGSIQTSYGAVNVLELWPVRNRMRTALFIPLIAIVRKNIAVTVVLGVLSAPFPHTNASAHSKWAVAKI
ncbi:MAG: hypothetical protein ABJC13_19045 [Acidobacteriota bacterium]